MKFSRAPGPGPIEEARIGAPIRARATIRGWSLADGPGAWPVTRRVGRFRWQEVGRDVLNVLYESVIPARTWKRLGEYDTPDWLAVLWCG